MKRILFALTAFAGSLFAADDIAGFWKTVNENTGKAECVIAVYEYDGLYYGRIIGTFDDEGRMKDSIYAPVERAPGVIGNPFYSGLDIIWFLQDSGSKFKGKILDPQKGNVYNSELWIEGENLIVRGKLLFFGRSQEWLPAVKEDFPKGFKMPDLKKLVPVIPEVNRDCGKSIESHKVLLLKYEEPMRRTLFPAFILAASICQADSWVEWLDKHAPDADLLHAQQAAFAASAAPKIVHPDVLAIPIVENGECLVDVSGFCFTRVGMMADPNFAFESPDCNSGLPSASMVRLSVYQKLTKMAAYLDELAPLFGYEAGQVSIRVFEGLRDLETQQRLFSAKQEEIQKEHPDWTAEMAEAETCKWVSPVKNNVPVHSTGAAVDIRLWDVKECRFLDMGIFGVIWGSNPNAPTFSEGITDEQKKNRLFCLIAADWAGLVNYAYEFWHFSSGDRYAAYWLEKDPALRQADFGSARLD